MGDLANRAASLNSRVKELYDNLKNQKEKFEGLMSEMTALAENAEKIDEVNGKLTDDNKKLSEMNGKLQTEIASLKK